MIEAGLAERKIKKIVDKRKYDELIRGKNQVDTIKLRPSVDDLIVQAMDIKYSKVNTAALIKL